MNALRLKREPVPVFFTFYLPSSSQAVSPSYFYFFPKFTPLISKWKVINCDICKRFFHLVSRAYDCKQLCGKDEGSFNFFWSQKHSSLLRSKASLEPLTPWSVARLVPSFPTSAQVSFYLNKSVIIQDAIRAAVTLLIVFLLRSYRSKTFLLGAASIWGFAIGVLGWIIVRPVFAAAKRNAKLRLFKYSALFTGKIIDFEKYSLFSSTDPQGDFTGNGKRREQIDMIDVVLQDAENRKLEITFPLQSQCMDASDIYFEENMEISLIVFSKYNDFRKIEGITNIFVPETKKFFGLYPYINEHEFKALSASSF